MHEHKTILIKTRMNLLFTDSFYHIVVLKAEIVGFSDDDVIQQRDPHHPAGILKLIRQVDIGL